MAKVTLFSDERLGKIKPLQCVNNGPVKKRPTQCRGNQPDYAEAHIPFMRAHDSSFCASYGGEHSVDVNLIFTNFDRDVDDPDAYDFTLTDEYFQNTLETGTQIFYRLGSKIEHWKKKYNTKPPKDYLKWAQVCEHIIRHYNYGWADGFHWNIIYWEIWNEADMTDLCEKPEDSPCWGGTNEEFYKFYRVVAMHLKSCFPELKIGGPALACQINEWLDNFFASITAEPRVPLDFFSWHRYGTDVRADFIERSKIIREKLDKAGYTQAESILDEYNYVRSWLADYDETIKAVGNEKGASLVAALMCAAQNSSIDMMMYYDARPGVWNGLFDMYTFARRKGYYSIRFFSKLYEYGTQLRTESDDSDVYALAAISPEGKKALLVCYYADDDNAPSKILELDGCEDFSGRALLVNPEYNGEEVNLKDKDGKFVFRIKRNSFFLLND
ncbi:MAG: hypothetical protein J5746_09985 [Victivallales bacterium]|nr:hypothetical protein [Victivallales bacterium]